MSIHVFNRIMAIVSVEQSPERSYFLKELQQPAIIWGVRILFLVIFATMIIAYLQTKKNHKDGE